MKPRKETKGFWGNTVNLLTAVVLRASQTSKELSHQQDAIIFLVETANMADIHHTGLYTVLYILKQTYLHWPQLEFCIPPTVYKCVSNKPGKNKTHLCKDKKEMSRLHYWELKTTTSQTSKELSHQQDTIIFLVETANLANNHHTGQKTNNFPFFLSKKCFHLFLSNCTTLLLVFVQCNQRKRPDVNQKISKSR